VNHSRDRFWRVFFVVVLVTGNLLVLACHGSKPQGTTRYPFTGRVISVDQQAKTADIDGDLIQGYMEAMVMTYKVKPESTLGQLSPGDAIKGDLVVVDHDPRDETTPEEYWLENLQITGHASQPVATAPAGSFHMPAPGEVVPDFSFTNQDGKKITLSQYRGKTLFMTFIYTRCPFPEFCPRMSRNFAEIYKQLGSNASLSETHLLSISFDPEHDTPKVLRDYGFSVARTHDAALFSRWQFVAPKAADLAKIAEFFAVTIKREGGLITHNLSTAVIGPDGKIVKWYHGGDWQVSDLIKDAAAARVPKA